MVSLENPEEVSWTKFALAWATWSSLHILAKSGKAFDERLEPKEESQSPDASVRAPSFRPTGFRPTDFRPTFFVQSISSNPIRLG